MSSASVRRPRPDRAPGGASGPGRFGAALPRGVRQLAGPAWRIALGVGLVVCVGLLPWLSRTDPALTVLRARSADRAPSPEVLDAVRRQLGLDGGPFGLLARWAGGLLRGDAGQSWISGAPVLPSVGQAVGVSLSLVGGALVVAALVAWALSRRAAWGAAVLAALPEFLVGTVLTAVVGVRLGWLPALGWQGPEWMVLPSLALGVPAGAYLGRILAEALPAAHAEPWARASAARGVPARRIARHALHRAVPAVLPNLGVFAVGLTGGSVAVEQVFNIPGLGRLTLQAALAQDLPVLQTGILALVLLGAVCGALARLAARRLLGPALRDGALPTLRAAPPAGRRSRVPAALWAAALTVAVVALGAPRDPLRLDTGARLAGPSAAHPFGTDALGRDVLARLAHGALTTLTTALAVSAVALAAGLLLGLLPRLCAPAADTAAAVPAVVVALLTAGIAGSGPYTPALAVAAVAWAPLAAHTAALLLQERATPHIAAARSLGASRVHLLRRHLLPAVVPPVARHALLRVPAVALALASLGFLGLGAQPPDPDWGLLLAENTPYAERAPWAVLAPAAALAVLGAASATSANRPRNRP